MPLPAFIHFFADLPDPRIARCRQHALLDIVVIALCAILCGAEGWDDIQRFGLAKQDWLREQLGLELTNGIPSDDTFRRVLSRLDPVVFDTCLQDWTQTLRHKTPETHLALDGKVLRHSFDTTIDQKALTLVRAWACDTQLVLGSVAIEKDSNEIPALQSLLTLLDVSGAVVTADALHTQTETARQIVEQGADYVLCVKGNQPHLREDIANLFAQHNSKGKRADWLRTAPGRGWWGQQSRESGHGRQENRAISVFTLASDDPDWHDTQGQWANLRSLVRVVRQRKTRKGTSRQEVYYVSCLTDPARIGDTLRQHWHIENRFHWVLDVQMGEDASRIRRDHAPRNLATLRHIALNLLRRETSCKAGVKARQKKAGWDNNYLYAVLKS